MNQLSWRYNGKSGQYQILLKGSVVATAPTEHKREQAMAKLAKHLKEYEEQLNKTGVKT